MDVAHIHVTDLDARSFAVFETKGFHSSISMTSIPQVFDDVLYVRIGIYSHMFTYPLRRRVLYRTSTTQTT